MTFVAVVGVGRSEADRGRTATAVVVVWNAGLLIGDGEKARHDADVRDEVEGPVAAERDAEHRPTRGERLNRGYSFDVRRTTAHEVNTLHVSEGFGSGGNSKIVINGAQ